MSNQAKPTPEQVMQELERELFAALQTDPATAKEWSERLSVARQLCHEASWQIGAAANHLNARHPDAAQVAAHLVAALHCLREARGRTCPQGTPKKSEK